MKSFIGAFSRLFVLNAWVMGGLFPIFMFHRVVEKSDSGGLDEHLSVTRCAFEETIVFLKGHFQIVDIIEGMERDNFNERSVCAITFDDGWHDNYEVAFPILKKHHIPATIFLCVGMVGTKQRFWFERTNDLINQIFRTNNGFMRIKNYLSTIIPAKLLNTINDKKHLVWQVNNELKKMHPNYIAKWIDEAEVYFSIGVDENRSVMNWEEIQEMSNGNITFGSHGMNHNILTKLSAEEKYYEISESKKILSNKNINFVPILSFPNGNYDQETLDIAEEAGYKMLLTASINKCGDGISPLLANRINVSIYNSISNNLLAYSILKAAIKRKLYHRDRVLI